MAYRGLIERREYHRKQYLKTHNPKNLQRYKSLTTQIRVAKARSQKAGYR